MLLLVAVVAVIIAVVVVYVVMLLVLLVRVNVGSGGVGNRSHCHRQRLPRRRTVCGYFSGRYYHHCLCAFISIGKRVCNILYVMQRCGL